MDLDQLIIILFLSFIQLVWGQETWVISGNGITIGASQRTAGAIDYLTWNGAQFINAYDHGRELQIAITDGRGECYNPTEAGSSDDSSGQTSTSKLLGVNTDNNVFKTTSFPAFWLAPGEAEPNPSPTCKYGLNPTLCSNWTTNKAVSIGYNNIPNAIVFQFNFQNGIPETYIQVESPTGYMPIAFSSFYTFNPANNQVTPIDQGPGEEENPLIFSTPDQNYAMGSILMGAPTTYRSYARFFFPNQGSEPADTAKWSNVWRGWENYPVGTTFGFASIICVGNFQMVVTCMQQVAQSDPELLKKMDQ